MKKIILSLAAVLISVLNAGLPAATPEQEKAFVDAYKKAFETKDEAALKSFLYTKGADPMALQFYTMMITNDMGAKVTSIELVALTPDDVKKADEVKELPSGQKAKLSLKPTRKLVLKTETTDGDNHSSSSSECFVAEKDGKLVIPVPAPVK